MPELVEAWIEHAKKEIVSLRDLVFEICNDYVKKLGYNCEVSPHDVDCGGWGIAIEMAQMDNLEDYFIINIVFRATARPTKYTVLFEISKYWYDWQKNYPFESSERGKYIAFDSNVADDVEKILEKKLPKIIEKSRKFLKI